MKHSDLLKKVAKAAKGAGVEWVLARQGTNHEVWRCGSVQVSIPRHTEVNEITAKAIMAQLEPVFGEGWWR